MLTELGDWVVTGFIGDQRKTAATCVQMHSEDAAAILWDVCRASYPDVKPSEWILRCESRDSTGIPFLRFFRPEGSKVVSMSLDLLASQLLKGSSRQAA